MDRKDRYLGCLFGLAAGDAVGTTVEFSSPGSFEPVIDMTGGGPFNLKPGEWTDDTSMALCLAESLIEKKGFDPVDQLRRYVRWMRDGHLSSTGSCFDIGATIASALREFEREGRPDSGPTYERSAGNGSIMRLAPIPLFYAGDPEKAIELCAESSKTTHGTAACVDACRYFGALIVGAVNGATKGDLLSDHYCPVEGYWKRRALVAEIAEIASGSFKRKEPPEITGSGYVVKSLEAALWAFHTEETFKEGCLRAVNLGADADTTAAVYGQIAGAHYGAEGIPLSWRSRLALRSTIEAMALRLYELSETEPNNRP